MRVINRCHLDPEIDLASVPKPETLGGVDVNWTVTSNRLTEVSFTVTSVTFDVDAGGSIVMYSDTLMAKVFSAARFVGDRIRIQTGFDAIQPFDMVGNTPDEVSGESPQEEVYLQQHAKYGQRGIKISAIIARPFDAHQSSDFDHLAIPAAHVARGLRTSDPLERYEDFFKALEYFAARRPKDDPRGDTFDRQLSDVTMHIEPTFDQARIKIYRELRVQVVHTHARLGHIGPNDVEGIRRVQALLPEMERLVLALLRNPPAFPR